MTSIARTDEILTVTGSMEDILGAFPEGTQAHYLYTGLMLAFLSSGADSVEVNPDTLESSQLEVEITSEGTVKIKKV